MFYLFLTLALILIDQTTKILTINNIPFEESIGIIPGLLSFSYIKNPGAAWGMFAGGRWFFIIFTALVLILLTFVIIKTKSKNKIFNFSVSLVFAGAIGNFIDRVFRGGMVVDMIKLDFINFPVFNFADCCVVIGAVLLCVYILFYFDKEKNDGEN
ncbi:MAG: signal peptidase II [Ruminococcaceae bacterium]|nr:signal peptidase II [Oscillospiraceae bacterium]